jgi:hypothetical protein
MNRIVLSVVAGLLLAGAVAGFVAWRRATEPARARAELLELIGVDLRTLGSREYERARALILRFSGVHAWNPKTRIDPWRILRLSPGLSAERVVVVGAPAPEGATQVLWFMSFGENILDTQAVVEAGTLNDVEAGYHAEIGGWALVLRLVDLDGHPFRMIYAPHGRGWAVVRTEARDGTGIARLAVPWGRPRQGPWWAKTPPAEWAETLRGTETIELLVRLSWLGLRPGPSEVEAARADPRVRAAVEALRTSPNPWIREAAELALRPDK